jgi:hypothetical protein
MGTIDEKYAMDVIATINGNVVHKQVGHPSKWATLDLLVNRAFILLYSLAFLRIVKSQIFTACVKYIC